MSARTIEKAKEMIDELRQTFLIMAMKDRDVDQVYQVNFQMFPLSGPIKKGKDVNNEPIT
jgi:hypothetical protein